jgi:hypothetical protein
MNLTYGNVSNTFLLSVTLTTPVIVNANTTSISTINVPGLLTTDQITASKPTIQTGLFCVEATCLAVGVLSLQFANVTAGGLTPTANEVYTVEVNRALGPTPYPSVIQ